MVIAFNSPYLAILNIYIFIDIDIDIYILGKLGIIIEKILKFFKCLKYFYYIDDYFSQYSLENKGLKIIIMINNVGRGLVARKSLI